MSTRVTDTPSGVDAPASIRRGVRFSARDLMNVAIFAVIFIVVTYAIGMLGVISPLTWLIVVPLSIVVNGVTFMLFFTRVRHAGMITLFTTVVALFYLMAGNTIVSTVAILALGVLADAVAALGRYRSRWGAIWAYAVFGMSSFTPFVPILIDRQAYFTGSSWAQMGEDYIRAADALLSLPVVGALALAIAVSGLVGGLFGSAMLRKHFVRAGLA